MAVKKLQKNRMNSDGQFDVLHYETEADLVLMPDGTNVHDRLDKAVTVDGGGAFAMADSLGVGPYTITFTEEEDEKVPASLIAYDGTSTGLSADNVQRAIDDLAENGKAAKPSAVKVILSAAGWDSIAKTQTVTVTGVSADENVQLITPNPAMVSQAAYYDAGIICTGQAANSLTFKANTVPTADLTAYVVIQEIIPPR